MTFSAFYSKWYVISSLKINTCKISVVYHKGIIVCYINSVSENCEYGYGDILDNAKIWIIPKTDLICDF